MRRISVAAMATGRSERNGVQQNLAILEPHDSGERPVLEVLNAHQVETRDGIVNVVKNKKRECMADSALDAETTCSDSIADSVAGMLSDPEKNISSLNDGEDLLTEETDSLSQREADVSQITPEACIVDKNSAEDVGKVISTEHRAVNTVSEHALQQLCERFSMMFEQNGGAECTEKIKEIRDSTVRSINYIKDTNVDFRRLDTAVTGKLNGDLLDCEAAAAAEAVIKETKANRGDCVDDLIDDCAKLLAVISSKVCMSLLNGIYEREGALSDRVEQFMERGIDGVLQVRTVTDRFDNAIGVVRCSGMEDVMVEEVERLECVAVGYVRQCIEDGVSVFT